MKLPLLLSCLPPLCFFLTVNDSASNILMQFLTTLGFFRYCNLRRQKKEKFFSKMKKTQGLHAIEFVTLCQLEAFFRYCNFQGFGRRNLVVALLLQLPKPRDPHASLEIWYCHHCFSNASQSWQLKKDKAMHHLPVMHCLTEKKQCVESTRSVFCKRPYIKYIPKEKKRFWAILRIHASLNLCFHPI